MTLTVKRGTLQLASATGGSVAIHAAFANCKRHVPYQQSSKPVLCAGFATRSVCALCYCACMSTRLACSEQHCVQLCSYVHAAEIVTSGASKSLPQTA
eukprot:8846-Heterococcus_DN1.PRE.1